MTTHEDPYLERDLLERLRDRSVTGIIATPTGANIDAWRRLLDLGVSVTFVDRSIPDLPIDAVRIDNVDSAFTATDHLVRLGHTRIGIVSGPTTTTTGSERIEGYRRALAGADIPLRNELVHAVPFRGESGGDAVGALLSLHPRPPRSSSPTPRRCATPCDGSCSRVCDCPTTSRWSCSTTTPGPN